MFLIVLLSCYNDNISILLQHLRMENILLIMVVFVVIAVEPFFVGHIRKPKILNLHAGQHLMAQILDLRSNVVMTFKPNVNASTIA